MKKKCLCCMVFFCLTFGLFAGAKEDREFRDYIEQTKKNPANPKGMTVAVDYEKRIVYSAIVLPSITSEMSAEIRRQAKKAIIEAMKGEAEEIKVVKRLGIKFVFVYVTKSNDIITLELSPNDL